MERFLPFRSGSGLHQKVSAMERTHDTMTAESAAVEDMRKKIKEYDEQQAVDKALLPYMRGGKVAAYNAAKKRYIIRIPKAIQEKTGGQEKFTAETKAEAYHKVYVQLYGEHTSDITLASLFEAAIQERDNDPRYTDRTQTRTRQLWNRWLAEEPIVQQPIEKVKASQIIVLLQRMAAGCTMGRSTYTNVKSILHMCYDYAIAHDIVSTNIARECHPRVRFKPPKGGTYTETDRKAVMQYIELNAKWNDSVYYSAIYLMFCLCARIGEVKALKWGDYRSGERTLYIHSEVVPRNGKLTYVEHTKEAERGNRLQYLPAKACTVLNQMRPEDATADDFIFSTEHEEFLSTTVFNRRLAFVCREAGVPYQSSHKIRFYAVTAMARATHGDITATGRYAGHCCTQTTLHYIRYAQDEAVQKAAAAIALDA